MTHAIVRVLAHATIGFIVLATSSCAVSGMPDAIPGATPATNVPEPSITDASTVSPVEPSDTSTGFSDRQEIDSLEDQLGRYDAKERAILTYFAEHLLYDSVPDDVSITISRGQYDYAMDLVAPDTKLSESSNRTDGMLLIRLNGPFKQQFAVTSVEQFANPERGKVETKTVTSAFYVLDASDGRVLTGTSFFDYKGEKKNSDNREEVVLQGAGSGVEGDAVTLRLGTLVKGA